MNIILLARTDSWRANDCVILRDRRADHIRGVLRARVGDVLRVGLIGGLSGKAVVSAMDSKGVTLRVALADPPPKRHRFDIVLEPLPVGGELFDRVLKFLKAWFHRLVSQDGHIIQHEPSLERASLL